MNVRDNVPCQIEEGLFLGSAGAANNKDALKSKNTTHILTVAKSLRPSYPNDFVYQVIGVADRNDTNLRQYFDECFDFIDEAKRQGGSVLVHCFAGRSRSVTIVIAYLMKKHGMRLSEALRHVKSKRPQARPNSGFISQLLDFEKSLQDMDAECFGDDRDRDKDDDDDDNDSDSDEDDELFWKRKFYFNKLALCMAGALIIYYANCVVKEPCMVSYYTSMRWLTKILQGHWKRCVNMFRMDAATLQSLCYDLETKYGLKASRRMCLIEKVAMFLYTLALGASNRKVQERFQHSGETVSRYFNEVLKTVCLLAIDVVKPEDPEFRNIPWEIETNPKYMPHFKNCVGAIDVTHVGACVSPDKQIPFIGRKGVPTQSIMAACSFDMQFTFVWAGWESSVHDTHIFQEAIDNANINFPKPPQGKYYLVDAEYPNEYGFLGPYEGERYHLLDFQLQGQPKSPEEVFNHAHSSIHSVIKRTFGLWKKRWKILQDMPAYPYKTQVQIVVASMALHNYIRRKSQEDHAFAEFDRHPSYVPDDILSDVVPRSQIHEHHRPPQMDSVRNEIVASLMGQ